MTITEKDKKLLVVGGIFLAVVALILFVIKPGFTGFSENNAKIDSLKTKKVEMKTEIDALPTYEAQLDTAVSEYNVVAARVYGDLSSDKIQDAVINDLVAPCGLVATNFTISGVNKSGVTPYSVTTDENGDKIGTGGISTENANVRLANVTISVSGSTEQVITLLDKLNSTEGIYLQQTSFATAAESAAVSISFYMVLSETFA